jgi:TPR repeat protein
LPVFHCRVIFGAEFCPRRGVRRQLANNPLTSPRPNNKIANPQIIGLYHNACRCVIALIFVAFTGLICSPNDVANAQANFYRDLLDKITPKVRDSLSHLQERPSLYAMGMTEAELDGETSNDRASDQDVLYGQSLALAYEDGLEISPYFVLRALKEASRKPYPRVNKAVEAWIALAHSVIAAKTSKDFARLGDVESKKALIGKSFHDSIVEVAITDHPDDAFDKTTQLGLFITAMEREVHGVERRRAEQGLAPLKPTLAHTFNPNALPANTGDTQDAPPTDCDTYTASDSDPQAKAKAVPFEKINSALAVPACESAVKRNPNSNRLVFQLGRAYHKNNDFILALAQYRKAAERGNPSAQRNLGRMFEHGEGVPIDESQAFVWFRKAADQGYAAAQFDVGRMYENGRGVAKNEEKAVSWYRMAAEQGKSAQNNLGTMFLNGQGVAKDETLALTWYRKAADQGIATAQTNLAKVYHTGKGAVVDFAEALKWYRKAADQGDTEAQNNLGVMYNKNQGVDEDPTEAVKWFRKAADQGNDVAQNNLGELYLSGRGADQNYAEALKWFRTAAQQGNSHGQINLGGVYESGLGVKRDQAEAAKWYRKAADQGNSNAQLKLAALSNRPQTANKPQSAAPEQARAQTANDQFNARVQARAAKCTTGSKELCLQYAMQKEQELQIQLQTLCGDYGPAAANIIADRGAGMPAEMTAEQTAKAYPRLPSDLLIGLVRAAYLQEWKSSDFNQEAWRRCFNRDFF